jgi:transposase
MRDAEAIGEAVTRPTMRFVPTKEVEQQDIQALHRIRERLIGDRTALVNEVHGLMHEYGIVIPKGVTKFRQVVVDKLESEKNKLTALSQQLFWKLVEEFVALEERLAYYQEKLESLAKTHPECQRLMTIPGIGPITATALVAAVGDVTSED